MKYSKTALGLLNAQYRSVLRKCFLINAGLFALGAIATPANAELNDEITTSTGTAKVWNEASGGGAMYTNTDGTISFVGVNNGGADGLTAQIYSKNSSTNVGTRLNVTNNGIYYTVGKTNGSYEEGDQLTTITSVNGLIEDAVTEEGGVIKSALDEKQAKLTSSNAGNGIEISDTGVISAKAGDTTITVDSNGIKVGTIAQSQVSGLETSLAGKQNNLSSTQMNAVNSGITAAKVTGYDQVKSAVEDATTGLAAVNTALAGKQDNLSSTQMNAVNSGITAAKVSDYDSLKSSVDDATTGLAATNTLAANTAAAVNNSTSGLAATKAIADEANSTANANKTAIETLNGTGAGSVTKTVNDAIAAAADDYVAADLSNLTTGQQGAINSGITADKVNTYDGYATSKQDTLSTEQLAAANSGITADKVNTYDGYATSKQDTITDLATIRSGAAAGATALQKADITTGTTNGTISVDGSEVAVAGLGSAAYTDSSAYDAAGAAAAVDAKLGGSFSSTNTVADAIDGVAEDLGNVTQFAGSTTGNLSNSATPSATTNADNAADAIMNMDATIGQIHGLAATITDAQGAQNLEQGSTVSGHLTALAGAIGNRDAVGTGGYITAGATVAESLAALDTALGNVEDDKQDKLVIKADSGLKWNNADQTELAVKVNGEKGLTVTSNGIEINAGDTMQFSSTSGKLDIKYDTNTFEASSTDGLKITSKGIKSGMIDDGAVTLDKIAASAQATSITGSNNLATDAAVKSYVDAEIDNAIVDNSDGTVTLKGAATSQVYTVAGVEDYVKENAENADFTAGSSTVLSGQTQIGGAINTLGTAVDTINTAITVTADGNYIKTDKTAAENLGLLDTQVKQNADDIAANAIIDTAATSSAGYAADATVKAAVVAIDGALKNAEDDIDDIQTKITVTTAGNYIAASDEVAANLGALDSAIGKVAAGTYNAIAPANNVAANLQALDSAFTSGTIDASFDDTTVKTLKIDGANKITASGTTLDFAKNSLTNVQGLTLTDASGNTGTLSADANGISTNTNFDVNGTLKVGDANQFVVDDSGNISTSGTLAAGNTTITGTLSTTGNATIGGTLDAGATTVDSLTIDGTSYGINSTGAATFASTDTASLTVGSANAITSTASGVLNMGGNDLTNIDELTTTGNATIGGNTSIAGTLSAGATTISASGAGATTALNVTATDTSGSGSTTTFTVASDKATVGGDFEVTGDTNLSDTTVTGILTISDGATPTPNAINLAATSVNAKEYGGSSYSPQNVLGIDNDTFVDGKLSSTDSLSVFKDSDGTGTKYDEVFTVDNTGSISSDMLKTDNTNNTTTIGKDADTATNVLGKLSLNSTGAATDPYVNAIDDGTTAQTTGGANTMATVATVLKSAENGAYTGASDKNIAADSTIKTAIGALDTEIGADTDYGTGTLNNGVVGTATVKANIAAINDKLGNIPDTAVNGYDMTATGATLVGAVNKLDTNMEGVLGGIYNTTTGAYDNTALLNDTTPNGFETGAADLSDALKKYAENNQAATGVSYNADGSVATTYTKATTTNYAGLVANSSLKSAIEQLDGNIGTAIAGVNRSATLAAATTLAANTVNANIDALDTAIGNLDYTGGAVNYALANGSATDGIKTIVATIGTQANNYKGNLDAAGAGATINNNLDALDAAIGDRSNIASKNEAINQGTARNVAAGLKAAGDAIGDMNFGQSHYVSAQNDLSGAVRTLDSNLYRVETDLHDLKRDLNRGMASMAAMSALVPNPRAHGNTSLAIGTGAYSGHTAAAIGGFHYLTDNIMLNAGVAWGNSRDASYRMGVTFSW